MLERRRLTVASASILLMMLSAVPNAQAVVIDSATYAGHTYYLLSPSTWKEAELESQALGGHLVTIDDAPENAFVADTFGVFSHRRNLWIGLTDELEEKTFVWASGAPLVFENWAPGEPNDCDGNPCVSEDFVHMTAFGSPFDGMWNDLVNDLGDRLPVYGVAEVDHLVPEPSSLLLLGPGLAAVLGRIRRRRCRRAVASSSSDAVRR